MKRRKIKTTLVAIVLAIAVAAGVVVFAVPSFAFWDESKAVHIKAAQIEPSTLAIGTHLIHLSALNDALYAVAQESATESGQSSIYYKSELGNNAWFDITTASTLEDITTGGTPVTDAQMETLFFRYHTKSDKKTYDLLTGAAVNIFDLRDPYDLEALDELQPLKMQYDMMRESAEGSTFRTDQIDAYIWRTETVEARYEGNVLRTSELKEQLNSLQANLNTLFERDASSEETNIVSGVMEKVDACRRYVVFYCLDPQLESYSQYLSRQMADAEKQQMEDDDDDDDKIIAPTTELISAVVESQGNVQSAMLTQSAKMLTEGVTVMSMAEYEFASKLVRDAAAQNSTACDEDVRNLLILERINSGTIVDREAELALLNDTLIPRAVRRYADLLAQGESSDYRAAKANGASQPVLNGLIKAYEGELTSRSGEMSFLADARAKRLDPAGGQESMEDLMSQVADLSTEIPNGDFSDAAEKSVESAMGALSGELRSLQKAGGGNEMDRLMYEKEKLQTQRLAALDKNDLQGAQDLEEKIAEVDQKLRDCEQELSAQIALVSDEIGQLTRALSVDPENDDLKRQLSEAKGELLNLQNSMTDGSLGAVIAQLEKENPLGLIDMLAADPTLVLPAIQRAHDDLVLSGGDPAQIEALEQAILDNPSVLGALKSADELKNAIESAIESVMGGIGSTFDKLDGGPAISVIAALEEYYEQTGNRNALKLLQSLALRLKNKGDRRVFERIDDSAGEYLTLTAVQDVVGRRFVWEESASRGILARGKDYYEFTLHSAAVRRDRDGQKTQQMARITKKLGGMQIPEEYAEEELGVWAVYLSESTLAVACCEENTEQIQEILDLLLQG